MDSKIIDSEEKLYVIQKGKDGKVFVSKEIVKNDESNSLVFLLGFIALFLGLFIGAMFLN